MSRFVRCSKLFPLFFTFFPRFLKQDLSQKCHRFLTFSHELENVPAVKNWEKKYRKVVRSRWIYYSIFQHFWGAIETCYYPRHATARDFTVTNTFLAKIIIVGRYKLASPMLLGFCQSRKKKALGDNK